MNSGLILCLSIGALLLSGCVVILVNINRKMKERQDNLEEQIQYLVKMNNTLRSQRHDYLNNMQVVYGMIELEEYQELHDYLEPMYQDMMKTGKALKTAIPAVNALLMAKMSEAENKGIAFYIEVKSNLKDIPVVDWELCRILSNLIDNAIRAVREADDVEDKKVCVDITERANNYEICVIDNGIPISDEDKENIFKPGVTTKKEDGHGMGLHIVSNLVEKYNGTIQIITNENEKRFEIKIGKR